MPWTSPVCFLNTKGNKLIDADHVSGIALIIFQHCYSIPQERWAIGHKQDSLTASCTELRSNRICRQKRCLFPFYHGFNSWLPKIPIPKKPDWLYCRFLQPWSPETGISMAHLPFQTSWHQTYIDIFVIRMSGRGNTWDGIFLPDISKIKSKFFPGKFTLISYYHFITDRLAALKRDSKQFTLSCYNTCNLGKIRPTFLTTPRKKTFPGRWIILWGAVSAIFQKDLQCLQKNGAESWGGRRNSTGSFFENLEIQGKAWSWTFYQCLYNCHHKISGH